MTFRQPLKSKIQKGQILSNALYRLYQLRREQWLSIDELRAIQLKQLKKMARHAYTNVPYYRRLFDSIGFKPEDIKTLEDIKKIPITRKADLKSFLASELLSENVSPVNLIRRHTSGSTGVPFNVYHSWEDKVFQHKAPCIEDKRIRKYGYSPEDDILRI